MPLAIPLELGGGVVASPAAIPTAAITTEEMAITTEVMAITH